MGHYPVNLSPATAGEPEDESASVLHQARSGLPGHHPGGLLPRTGPLMAGGATRWLSRSRSAAAAADTLLSDLVVREGKHSHTHKVAQLSPHSDSRPTVL